MNLTLTSAKRCRYVMAAAVVVTLGALSPPTSAQAPVAPTHAPPDKAIATESSPVTTAASTDDPLAHDRGFAGGNFFGDAFAGSPSNYNLGRRLVRLPNGDVVSAGLVAHVGASNTVGRNLGLVRYNSAGQRIAWTNPGSGGHFSNQYIITPNQANASYTEVVDIVATATAQDRIFVLLNTDTPGGNKNINIIAFGFDGSFRGAVSPFLNTPGDKTGAGLVYYREGLAETYKLVVIGTRFDTTKGRVIYRRMNAAGFDYETAVQDVHPTNGPCSVNIQTGGCIATSVTSVTWSAFDWLPPRIYVAGVTTHNSDPNATNFFVTRIIGGNNTGVGYADSSFGTGGTREVLFDVVPNGRDYATGVAARRGPPDPSQPLGNNTGDEVYVVGQVAQQCTPGIGVAAFNHNGTPADFGTGGKLRFGGQDAPCNQFLRESADFAHAVVYDGDRLVIAGMSVYEPFCLPGNTCEDNVDPMMAIVRGRDAVIQEHRDFPVQPGGRNRHGGLYDVVVTGAGTYAVTGDGRFPASHATYPGGQEFITTRLQLDRIFANGTDCGGGYPAPSWPGCN